MAYRPYHCHRPTLNNTMLVTFTEPVHYVIMTECVNTCALSFNNKLLLSINSQVLSSTVLKGMKLEILELVHWLML